METIASDILIYRGNTDGIPYILLMVKGRELCKGTIFFSLSALAEVCR